MPIERKKLQQFKHTVWNYYHTEGRHDLPWRKTIDPYRIAVSELMLQQTQVSRVIEKYNAFLKAFPTIKKLAQAPLVSVLALWSGLGYNRRAKFLHALAKEIDVAHKGVFPQTVPQLEALPGIGPYTARAIATFAYNTPQAFIETNIRTVYIHHFFSEGTKVSDAELQPLILETIEMQNPREWFWALMDYGSMLKKQGNVSHRTSVHYVKQSPFKGSKRQVRGKIMKLLLERPYTLLQLKKIIPEEYLSLVLKDLIKEEFITREKNTYRIS